MRYQAWIWDTDPSDTPVVDFAYLFRPPERHWDPEQRTSLAWGATRRGGRRATAVRRASSGTTSALP